MWGVGDLILGSKKNHVATVGNHFVTASEFAQQLKEGIEALEHQYKQNLSVEMIAESGLNYAVLNRLINRELLNEEIHSLKIAMPPELLRQNISKIPSFQEKDTQFSREKFRSVLVNQGMTEQNFIKIFEQELNRQQLLNILHAVSTSLKFPKFMSQLYYQWMYAPRGIKIIDYKDKDIVLTEHVTDELLQDFYNRESRHFVTPETRDIQVIWLDPREKAKHIDVEDMEINQYYKENPQTFMSTKRRVVEVRDFQTLADAEKFLTQKQSNLPKKTQTITEDMFSPEVAAVLFNLKVSEHSPPLQANDSYRLYTIKAIEPEKLLPFDTVKTAIKERLQLEKNQNSLQEEIKQIDDALASGTTVEDVVKNYTLHSTIGEKIAAVEHLQDHFSADFLKEIVPYFTTLHEGDVSPFITTANGVYIAVIVRKITPKKQPDLQEIKDKLAAAWEQKERQRQADKQANAIISELNKGEKIEAVIREKNKKIENLEVHFAKPSEKISPEILKALISMTPGQSAAVRSKDRTTVVFLEKIEKIKIDANHLKELEDRLSEAWAQDLLNGYLETIRQRVSVGINQNLVHMVINSLKGQQN